MALHGPPEEIKIFGRKRHNLKATTRREGAWKTEQKSQLRDTRVAADKR